MRFTAIVAAAATPIAAMGKSASRVHYESLDDVGGVQHMREYDGEFCNRWWNDWHDMQRDTKILGNEVCVRVRNARVQYHKALGKQVMYAIPLSPPESRNATPHQRRRERALAAQAAEADRFTIQLSVARYLSMLAEVCRVLEPYANESMTYARCEQAMQMCLSMLDSTLVTVVHKRLNAPVVPVYDNVKRLTVRPLPSLPVL